jgi:hypothetical protein
VAACRDGARHGGARVLQPVGSPRAAQHGHLLLLALAWQAHEVDRHHARPTGADGTLPLPASPSLFHRGIACRECRSGVGKQYDRFTFPPSNHLALGLIMRNPLKTGSRGVCGGGEPGLARGQGHLQLPIHVRTSLRLALSRPQLVWPARGVGAWSRLAFDPPPRLTNAWLEPARWSIKIITVMPRMPPTLTRSARKSFIPEPETAEIGPGQYSVEIKDFKVGRPKLSLQPLYVISPALLMLSLSCG